MAIRKTDPDPIGEANAVLVDSDAPTNAEAIREIDEWGTAHGFVRTNEYWLRVIVCDNKKLFRGVCYPIKHLHSDGSGLAGLSLVSGNLDPLCHLEC